MAAPITTIRTQKQTKADNTQQKLTDLQELLADNEEALNKIFGIVSELNDMGALEAANSMLKAKEEIAGIALHQVSREPITNLINHLLGATTALSAMDPDMTAKLTNSLASGMNEAAAHHQNNKPIGMLDLLKVLKDPDINRAIGFGIHFLKGMGKELGEEK